MKHLVIEMHTDNSGNQRFWNCVFDNKKDAIKFARFCINTKKKEYKANEYEFETTSYQEEDSYVTEIWDDKNSLKLIVQPLEKCITYEAKEDYYEYANGDKELQTWTEWKTENVA